MIAGIQNHPHFCKPPTALPLSVSLYDCREVSLYGCPEKQREDGEHIAGLATVRLVVVQLKVKNSCKFRPNIGHATRGTVEFGSG
jgi:hypothetical protein